MEIIEKYFPDLNQSQRERLGALGELYEEWNEKVNLISRKDMDHFYERHVLHSLSIALVRPFESGLKVMDLGSGGGFPGIPLAILYPECEFLLVDSRKKKMTVVNDIINQLNIENVRTVWARAEELDEKFDLVLCRAVATIDKLIMWISGKVNKAPDRPEPGGLIALKGGDLSQEISDYRSECTIIPLSDVIEESFFNEKKLLHFMPDCVYL